MYHHLQVASVAVAGVCAIGLIGSSPVWGDDLTTEEQARHADLEARPLHNFSNIDLADYLRLRSQSLDSIFQRPAPAEEIGHFARKAIGQRFRLNAKRFDLTESDCIVFVERAIAMSCATNWESYYKICERLRHKSSDVAYKNRNFSTLGDWLPNNLAWGIFEDITGQLGPVGSPVAQTFTHVVRPKVFEEFPAAPNSKYTRIVYKGSDYKSPDLKIISDVHVPRERIFEVLSELRTGDLVLVLRNSANGHLGCDHMCIVSRSVNGQCDLLHSAPSVARIETFAHFTKTYDFVVGFKFLRVRDSARTACLGQIQSMGEFVKVRTPEQVDAATKKP